MKYEYRVKWRRKYGRWTIKRFAWLSTAVRRFSFVNNHKDSYKKYDDNWDMNGYTVYEITDGPIIERRQIGEWEEVNDY